jgi:hypothetical protein
MAAAALRIQNRLDIFDEVGRQSCRNRQADGNKKLHPAKDYITITSQYGLRAPF